MAQVIALAYMCLALIGYIPNKIALTWPLHTVHQQACGERKGEGKELEAEKKGWNDRTEQYLLNTET